MKKHTASQSETKKAESPKENLSQEYTEQTEEAQPSQSSDGSAQAAEPTAEEKAQEYLDQMLRIQAEFDNYRKRVMREKSDLIKYAKESILTELLPIRDNFLRALAALEEHINKENHKFFEGVELIFRQLEQLMEKNNVVQITAHGQQFNPQFHSAVQQIETDEYPENTVVQELEKGYMFHDKLLRPATVVVSKTPIQTNQENNEVSGSGKE